MNNSKSYMIAGGKNFKNEPKAVKKWVGKVSGLMPYDIENIGVPARYFYGETGGYHNPTGISTGGVSIIAKKIHQRLKEEGVMQYVKIWVKSETYAGGNSIRVYFDRASDDTIELSKKIMDALQYGYFDGMNDIYEYKQGASPVFALNMNGTEIELNTKYNFVYDQPPYGTPEYEEYKKRQEPVN